MKIRRKTYSTFLVLIITIAALGAYAASSGSSDNAVIVKDELSKELLQDYRKLLSGLEPEKDNPAILKEIGKLHFFAVKIIGTNVKNLT